MRVFFTEGKFESTATTSPCGPGSDSDSESADSDSDSESADSDEKNSRREARREKRLLARLKKHETRKASTGSVEET